MFRISDEIKKTVYEKYERSEKTVTQDVEIIKKWMETQPHLPEILDDHKILNFLSLSKFSIEKTKRKIDMYYTVRSLIPDFYTNSNPKLESLQKMLDFTYISVHPAPYNGTDRVWFLKCKEPNTLQAENLAKVFFSIFEFRLCEDFLTDDIFIFDFKNLTLGDLKQLTPSIVKNAVTVLQKVYSLRLKEIHYLNSPSYVTILLSIMKAVTKPKVFDRIQVHQGDEVVKKFFRKEQLPKDYKGQGPSLEELNEIMRAKFAEYGERFDALDHLKVNEDLRPQKLDNDEILGYYGNFKRIDLD